MFLEIQHVSTWEPQPGTSSRRPWSMISISGEKSDWFILKKPTPKWVPIGEVNGPVPNLCHCIKPPMSFTLGISCHDVSFIAPLMPRTATWFWRFRPTGRSATRSIWHEQFNEWIHFHQFTHKCIKIEFVFKLSVELNVEMNTKNNSIIKKHLHFLEMILRPDAT